MPTAIIMVLKVNKKKLFNFDFIIPSFVCIVNLPCRNVNEFHAILEEE